MTRSLIYSRKAEGDLDEIFDFIAQENPKRARTYIEEIRQACLTLCTTPRIGPERSELRPGLRILPLWRRIVVAYDLPPDRVRVLRVFSGGQDYGAMMAADDK